LFAARQQRIVPTGDTSGRAVHQRDHLDAAAEPGDVAERGEMRLSRDAARPDDGTPVPLRPQVTRA